MGNSLKEIRKEIASIKNIQKTTRAMKLVANSKLKKAVEAAKRRRIYATKLNEVFNDIIQKTLSNGNLFEKNDILFVDKDRAIKMVDIVFITSDKGLCGAFNSNTIKSVVALMNEYKKQDIKVRLRGVGKTGIRYFNFNEIELCDESDTLSIEPTDDEKQILDELVRQYINYNMFYALIDSLAAELSARMQAMDTATENAAELVRDLTIKHNKARQAAITTELGEINAGAEAMK